MRTIIPEGPAGTYAAVLDALPIVAYIARPDGVVSYLSRGWAELTGHNPQHVLDHGYHIIIHPDDLPDVDRNWRNARAGGGRYRDEFRIRFADGTYHWMRSQAEPFHDHESGELLGLFGTAVEIEEQHRAVEAYAKLEKGLSLLARAGAATVNSLDYVATLRNIAQVFVPEFASYAIVDVVESDGEWRRIVIHTEPEMEGVILAVSRPEGRHPIARAIDRGESSVIVINDDWLRMIDTQNDRANAARRLHVDSLITVPIMTPNGEIVGALTCARDITHAMGRYAHDDLTFVEEIGRRAGTAISNVRLYERQQRIAVELQAASLPVTLPRLDHLHLDADYRPGSEEATIGGDWYDAFSLDDGRVVLTVGDVLGHGLHAAITMAKLRQALQSAAMLDPDPNVMLKVADKTLRLIDPDGYATAAVAIYDCSEHTLTLASAGHPGPVVRTKEGDIQEYTSPGLMLGLRSGDETDVAIIPTPPECTIIFFTDGLVESARDMEASSIRLHAALRRDDIVFGNAPARAIVEYVLDGGGSTDDIAVLVARTGPASDPPASPERQATCGEAETRRIKRDGSMDASSEKPGSV